MNILLIHQNFPGQWRYLAEQLNQLPGIRLLSVGREYAPGLKGIRLIRYPLHRSATTQTHPYARDFESGILHGQAVIRALQPLYQQGYRPDWILAHPGWGETLYLKDLFPHARLLHYCEYYYHSHGADAGFDPEFPLALDSAAKLRSRNALHLLNLQNADIGVCPTLWQHSLHPEAYQPKLKVIHEGIPFHRLFPDCTATLTLPSGGMLRAGDKVITYVARNLEPYRGFHRLMRALPHIMQRHPDCHVVIVGGDGVSYGQLPADGMTWREKMLAENPLDLGRVHFLGKIPYSTYLKVLQLSAVHIYLTYPFVLSWSLLEAMACGCQIVASNTAPVREVIQHGENGYLVDFFDQQALIDTVESALTAPAIKLRQQARETAWLYRVEKGWQQYAELLGIERVINSGVINHTPTIS